MIASFRKILLLLCASLIYNAQSYALTSVDISSRTTANFGHYVHYKITGVCFWFGHDGKISETLEVDEYVPDLVVAVYDDSKSLVWSEAREFLSSTSSVGRKLIPEKLLYPASTGSIVSTPKKGNTLNLRKKNVLIVGHPLGLIEAPFAQHKPSSTPLKIYYYSPLDVTGRIGIAETFQINAFSNFDPFHHIIGESILDHWGYEFPRDMTILQSDPYKAAAVLAQRAADLVTNTHTLHTVIGRLSNTCGKNCAIAAITEEDPEDKALWQMVYPYNLPVHIGKGFEENRWYKKIENREGKPVDTSQFVFCHLAAIPRVYKTSWGFALCNTFYKENKEALEI